MSRYRFPWTEEELEILRANVGKVSFRAFHHLLPGRTLTAVKSAAQAQGLLRPHFWGTPKASLVRQIITEEAAPTPVPPEAILTKDRRAAVSWVRSRCCKRLKALGYTNVAIGFSLNLDHSSVIWSLRRTDTDGKCPTLLPRKEKPSTAIRQRMAPPPQAPATYTLQVSKAQLMGARA